MLSYSQFQERLNESTVDKVRNEDYGQECVLDVHEVSKDKFHKKFIREFAEKLCDEIGMIRGPSYSSHIWGEEKDLETHPNKPKIDGISLCQFLYSSSITLHFIDELGKVFINVFSCKNFDAEKVKSFALDQLGGTIAAFHNIIRK